MSTLAGFRWRHSRYVLPLVVSPSEFKASRDCLMRLSTCNIASPFHALAGYERVSVRRSTVLCSIQLQVSNWEARPLSQRQLVYASQDAHVLLMMLGQLRELLPDADALITAKMYGVPVGWQRSCSLCVSNQSMPCLDEDLQQGMASVLLVTRTSPPKRCSFAYVVIHHSKHLRDRSIDNSRQLVLIWSGCH